MRTARKTPRERFHIVTRKRLERAVGALRRLERCANRATYEYSDDEALQLLEYLDKHMARLRVAFEPEPRLPF